MNEVSLKVDGMSCNHCKMTIENMLAKIEGIDSVNADILSGTVRLTGNNIQLPLIESVINNLGYIYRGTIAK